jgi:hypothetical protein
MIRSGQKILVIAITVLIGFASPVQAGIVTFTTPGIAIQDVELFTGTPLQVDATLTAIGSLTWNLDIDANGNTINSDSSVIADFVGTLPAEFGKLGLAGVAFDLHSLLAGQSVTITNNGTLVTVNSNFGITVPAAGTTFYTVTPSEFITSILGVPFSTFHFTSPAVTGVYIGDNPLTIDPGTLVGASFDRTVSSVPEPSSAVLLVLGGVGLAIRSFRHRRFRF